MRLHSLAISCAVLVTAAACSASNPVLAPAPASGLVSSARSGQTPGAAYSPTKDNYLASIACPTATNCIAVGHVGPGIAVAGPENHTLIEQDTGQGWQIVSSPNAPDAAGSVLSAITCPRPTECIAVGESQSEASIPRTLIEQNIGGGWNIVPSPNSTAFEGIGSLNGVACATQTHCIAVGDYESESGRFQTLIEENSGAGWSVVSSPNSDPGEDNLLHAVTCPGPSLCFAVGEHGGLAGDGWPLIERNSGSGWSLVQVDGMGSLAGIACPGPLNCVATGGLESITGSTNMTITIRPLIEEMTDGAWTLVDPPSVVGILGGVACAGIAYCISVGTASLASTFTGSSALVAAERIGGVWVISQMQSITATGDGFSAVACADARKCIAVGDQLGSGYPKPRETLVAEHASQGWVIETSPNV